MITNSDIFKLTKQLLPTGRAWRLSENGIFKKLLFALGKSEVRAYNFALSTLDRILPDNDGFENADATEWERRLNIIGGIGYVPLEVRKSTIKRKYQFPGGYLNRQSHKYMESQLQLSGFDVTVTENYEELGVVDSLVHSTGTVHKLGNKHGKSILVNDLVANSVDKGEIFDIDTYKGVFYVDGNVPFNSVKMFRQLILMMKPANTVAVLRVSYTNSRKLIYMNGNQIFTASGKQLVLVK